MYAASLAVAVEMGILPIHAIDLLRVRLSGALLGAAAALSSLVTSEASASPIVTQFANETLKHSRESISEHRAASDVKPILRTLQQTGRSMSWVQVTRAAEAEQLAQGELPDLTERLRRAGVLDKYVAWRDSYFQWRTGQSKGAKGELGAADAANSAARGDAAAEPSPSMHTLQEDEESTAPPTEPQPGPNVVHTSSEASPPVGFAPPPEAVPACTTLEPLAGVALPSWGTEDTSILGDGGAHDPNEMANSIILKGADPAFLQGTANAKAPEEHTSSSTVVGCGKLDLGAALDMPQIQELLRQRTEEPDEARVVHDVEADVVERENTPSHELWKKSRILSHAASVFSSQFRGVSGNTEDVERAELNTPPAQTLAATSADKPSAGVATMSLAQVHLLLDEIDSALAPSADLAIQAGERLDAHRIDTHMWQRLATAMGVVRLRLSMLARIALRLQHGVRVTDLMGGEQRAAENLVEAFGGALAAATAAVAGGTPTPPRMCAELEAKLRASSEALVDALARRRSAEHSKLRTVSSAEVTSEVLAGTAAHILIALLSDASELLVLACALSGGGGGFSGVAEVSAEVGPLASAASSDGAIGGNSVALALPDLTARLKEAGTYDKYLAWRDGYMKWRTGSGHGAKGEMTDNTTT